MSPKHNLSPYKQQKGTLKTVSLTSFRKPPDAICFNLLLQVYPSVLPSIFVVINTSSFYVLSGYFYVAVNLVAVPSV